METVLNIFDIRTIAFTFLSYSVSYLELIGTIFYLLSVFLITRKNILTWPTGIISVILFMILFYQIRLYSDTIEQIYYLVASVYGWIYWVVPDKKGVLPEVRFTAKKKILIWIIVTIVISLLTGALMSRIHLYLPALFPEKASFPFIDAFTTIMSFVAMWLLAKKRIESWIYWVIIDCIGIWLYYVKGVYFLSLLYCVLLVLAIQGLLVWKHSFEEKRKNKKPSCMTLGIPDSQPM